MNRLCVVDSTALTALARKDLLDLAKKFKVPSALILFNVPLETCVERDEKRQRAVGRVIIERQYQTFEEAKTKISQEGFDQVIELQDGDLERVQIEILFRPLVRPTPNPQRPETGAASSSERSAQPFRTRPSGPGDGRPAPPPRVEQPTQRTAAPAPSPAPKTAPEAAVVRHSADVHVGLMSSQAPGTVNPPVPPAAVNKPASPTAAVASTETKAPASPSSVPVGAPSSGGS